MSVLKKLEEKIQGLFEGSFGRAFKSPVQPVEIARKLVKEMDDNKVVSVSRVYVPNEYTLFLSAEDGEQFSSYEDHLKRDLSEYLSEHARKEGYDLLSVPKVIIEQDEDLGVGEFGIATRMVSGPEPPGQEVPELEAGIGQTVVYQSLAPEAGNEGVSSPGQPQEIISLVTNDGRYRVNKPAVLLGRSKQADMLLQDPNVSRRHAELRQRGNNFFIIDLGSTNGIEVNGVAVSDKALQNGDIITLGTTKVRFERQIC